MRKFLHDRARAEMEESLPPHMHGAIERYIDQGIHPGGFLASLINNDLKGAITRADNKNLPMIPEYVRWFTWFAPAQCWGYPGATQDWMQTIKEVNSGDSE